MKLIQKYGKKKVYIASTILIIACIAIGISTWYIMEQYYKQKILDSIGITFVEDTSIEYGTEKVDFNSFIKDRIGEPEIQLPIEEINTKELGKKQVTYVLSKEGYSKNEALDVEIKDTIAPEIKFKEDEISIEEGDEFNLLLNIESVNDPIDGDIKMTTEEILKDGYIVKSDIDTSNIGEYSVNVSAFDKNGNKAEKQYKVIVIEKEKMKQTEATINEATNNTASKNQMNSDNDTGKKDSNNIINHIVCPNGKEPRDINLPCNAVIIGAWTQANPREIFDSQEDASIRADWLMMNDLQYADKYSSFVVTPCTLNDGSRKYLIIPE